MKSSGKKQKRDERYKNMCGKQDRIENCRSRQKGERDDISGN